MSGTPEIRTGEIDARGKSSQEINREIKELIAAGEKEVRVFHTGAQHNLGVAILSPISVTFDGSVGYYCGALIDGPTIEVRGSAGWGLGESMLAGTIHVRGSVGNSCAASIRGGSVIVQGSAGARAGIAMKGGLLVVEGDCGYMTGFMMQKGVLIVCGNAGPALGDSMYEGVIFVAGEILDLGNDASVRDADEADKSLLREKLGPWGISPDRPFKKIVSGRRLWNFDKQDFDLWKEAL
jgi:methylamine---glutamate N-methyltransferase subunit B